MRIGGYGLRSTGQRLGGLGKAGIGALLVAGWCWCCSGGDIHNHMNCLGLLFVDAVVGAYLGTSQKMAQAPFR